MLISIHHLRNRVQEDCKGLVNDLQQWTGRYGDEEAKAWENSLSKLCEVFWAPSFEPLHLYFGSRGNLALEYQLPASSSWCDVVLLGSHQKKPSAVIIELKDWVTRGDKPGRFEGLIERHGSQELHPSDQVRGYTEYCRRFHSVIENYKAEVHGCVLFTRDHWANAYAAPPNETLAGNYPFFTVAPNDVNGRFPEFFKDRLSEPNEEFALAFANGCYRQNRGFVAQIGKQILEPMSFTRFDGQRMGVQNGTHSMSQKKEQKYYDEAFKQQAVNLVVNRTKPISQIARELGVSEYSLHLWRKKYAPGSINHQGVPIDPSRSREDLEKELQALRSENQNLRIQRDILKKTLGILSEPPSKNTSA